MGSIVQGQVGINQIIFLVLSDFVEMQKADSFKSLCGCQSRPVNHWELHSGKG